MLILCGPGERRRDGYLNLEALGGVTHRREL